MNEVLESMMTAPIFDNLTCSVNDLVSSFWTSSKKSEHDANEYLKMLSSMGMQSNTLLSQLTSGRPRRADLFDEDFWSEVAIKLCATKAVASQLITFATCNEVCD